MSADDEAVSGHLDVEEMVAYQEGRLADEDDLTHHVGRHWRLVQYASRASA